MYADLLSRTHATNKIHVLDTETMTWSKPNVAGTLPLPRYRHATVMHGSQMYCYGGFGGGAELHVLDTGIMDEAVLERDASKRRKGGGVRGSREDSGNELIAWLEGLGLGKYTRVFIRQEVDFDTRALTRRRHPKRARTPPPQAPRAPCQRSTLPRLLPPSTAVPFGRVQLWS